MDVCYYFWCVSMLFVYNMMSMIYVFVLGYFNWYINVGKNIKFKKCLYVIFWGYISFFVLLFFNFFCIVLILVVRSVIFLFEDYVSVLGGFGVWGEVVWEGFREVFSGRLVWGEGRVFVVYGCWWGVLIWRCCCFWWFLMEVFFLVEEWFVDFGLVFFERIILCLMVVIGFLYFVVEVKFGVLILGVLRGVEVFVFWLVLVVLRFVCFEVVLVSRVLWLLGYWVMVFFKCFFFDCSWW